MENKQQGELHKLSLVNQKQPALLYSFERMGWRVKQQMYYLNKSKIFDKNLSQESYSPKSTQIGLDRNTTMWPETQRLVVMKKWKP